MIESPGYHSYDAVDYAQIEAGYGTNEQFRLLIDEAHARDSADKFNNAVACVKTIGYNGKGHNNWLW